MRPGSALAFAGAIVFTALPAWADPPRAMVVVVPAAPPAPLAAPPPGAYLPGAYPPAPWAYYAPPGPYYPPAYPAPPLMERRSVGAMAAGIVALTGTGIMLAAASFTAIPSCRAVGPAEEVCADHGPTIIGLLVGSAASLALGIPLVVFGAKKVPAAALAGGSPLPAWAGAPGGPGWRWQF